jgi:hypothetical protein
VNRIKEILNGMNIKEVFNLKLKINKKEEQNKQNN